MNYIQKTIEKLKEYIKLKGKKKVIENSVIVIIIGIVLIIAGDTFLGDKEPELNKHDVLNDNAVSAIKNTLSDEKKQIEANVEKILSQIKGAGKVNILITYVSGKEDVLAFEEKKSQNDTTEKDNEGGTRSVQQNSYENKIAYEDLNSGEKKAVVVKELTPEVRGVVVVADGAGNEVVREAIIRALVALMDVPVHKIQVFEREK